MTAKDSTFGDRLREALVKRGISQRELARRIGLNEVSISRYVHGERRPDTVSLRNIVRSIGVTSDWLIGVDDDELSPVVMTIDDVRSIRKPMLVWLESRIDKKVVPVECFGVRQMLSGSHIDIVKFSESYEFVDTYGKTYRVWTIKPAPELRSETDWESEGDLV